MHSYTNPRTALPLPPKHRQMLQPRSVPALDTGYVLTDRAAVLGFLAVYPSCVPVLNILFEKLQAYFPDTALFLEVRGDPEATSPDAGELLVLVEARDQPLHTAFATLERFNDEWWLDHMDVTDGRVAVSIKL